MPPDACSSLCSRDSALASVFTRSDRSSVKSVSVIVSGGCYLLLGFFRVKPFSLIRSINVQSM